MLFERKYMTIFAIMVTEVLGFSLILPFLPFFAEEMGATPLVVGSLLTAFSLFQFISAPIMGRLSDYYGRKPLLVVSQLSTFVGFVILGFSGALWMIFLSRIVDGLLGSNFTIAQAYLSDISSKEDRSKAFGLSGVAFGLGFLVGPAIGGFLSRFGYSIPAFVAAGVSLVTIFTTLFFLPETVRSRPTEGLRVRVIDVSALRSYFSVPATARKLWGFFFFILAHVTWVSSFALYAERRVGLGASHVGYLLAYVGVIAIVFRGVLLGKMIDRFGERKLQRIGGLSMVIGLVVAIFVTQWWMFLITMTFFAFGTGLYRPLLLGSISRGVSPREQGAVMGVTNSLGSLAQIIGPLMGTSAIQFLRPSSLGLVGALTMGAGLSLVVADQARGRPDESAGGTDRPAFASDTGKPVDSGPLRDEDPRFAEV
jgi:DHA1 family tetracycline resistance protein-like MFS transporter